MGLPEGVQSVAKPSGRTYYYWAPQRGSKTPGARVALGWDTEDPEFWIRLRKARSTDPTVGTWDKLIEDYEASPEWEALRPATRRDYKAYMTRLALQAGDRRVAEMTAPDIYRMRDDMKATPVAANHMLSVMRTLIAWGIPRGYRSDNPVADVKRLKVEEGGAVPWAEEGYAFTIANAPTDLMRMAYLGRATGQRAGDLVRMRAGHMVADGINVSIGKRRELKHFVPLTEEQVSTIRSWGVADLDYFFKSARGKVYSADHLGSRWKRWRKTREALPIAGLDLTIHGLRATKISDLAASGASDRQIADEVGLSTAMVQRYLRFADKAAAARASRDERVFKLSERSRRVANLSSQQ